jgi:hypothetical protein
MASAQRVLVGSAFLAGIGEPSSRPLEQGILSPRFAEDCSPAWPQDAIQLASCQLQIKVMQDRVSPDCREAAIVERQALAVCLHQGDANVVGSRAPVGLEQIARREVEAGHLCASPGQHHGRHAMSATKIEDGLSGDFSKLLECGTDPGFVIEIGGIVKTQGFVVKARRSFSGLAVVKCPFGGQAVEGSHGGILSG